MALMTSQFGRARYANIITNRTGQSGGSVGGVKKAGIITFGPTWKRGNMGNYLVRAPQTTPTLAQIITLTTLHPVQRRRNGYAVSHGMM